MQPNAQSESQVTLLLMKGHPATGKSTLAYALARQLRWLLIDKDDIKDHTWSNADGNELAYRIMWQIVARQLQLGISVIVDSPLSYPVTYATGCGLAADTDARVWVIETRLDEQEWRKRLEARAGQDSSHKIGSWQAMQELLCNYDKCWQYPIDPSHHLIINTTASVANNIADVIKQMKECW